MQLERQVINTGKFKEDFLCNSEILSTLPVDTQGENIILFKHFIFHFSVLKVENAGNSYNKEIHHNVITPNTKYQM